jgi:hypothetical protein
MARSNRTNHTTPELCTPHTGQPSSKEAGAQEWVSRMEIALRSTSASTAIERRRWQVIGLLADGVLLAEIVSATGYRPRTIRQIAQRYRERGSKGLADGWQRNVGATPLLAEEQQRDLRQALQEPAPDGGVWTGPKSRGGLLPEPESACTGNAAGSICGGWVVLRLAGVAMAEMCHVTEVTTIPRARWYRGNWITFCDTDCSTNCSPREDDLECNRAALMGQDRLEDVEEVQRLPNLNPARRCADGKHEPQCADNR